MCPAHLRRARANAATRRHATAATAALVDPSTSGKRLVVTPRKLDVSKLEDVRKAEACGPRGLLLIGMSEEDCLAVWTWLQLMEPGFVVACCPPGLLAAGSLRAAVGDGPAMAEHAWEQQPADAPPIAFFSGLTGEEQVALMEGWREHTGLQEPAFASVTPTTLDKQLCALLADIVRAQAQQAPPGFDPEQPPSVLVATDAAQQEAQAQPLQSQQQQQAQQEQVQEQAGGDDAGAAGEGGEEGLRNRLQDYVMLNTGGQTEAAPMSLDQLKEQIQEKMRAKKAAALAEQREARREAGRDDTDRLRQALQGSRKQKGKAAKKGSGSSPSKGFGSK
ncbi:hypothetical protein D9Q98_009619 [Chlorella vulgaris]|uniref:Uncharacterized protein n=1 Tax=Chlorella vulgaris TaxID=3077 RepID=A0A9D4TFI5_CHLVU|nr:hypothetical protein D9Q98_009619 [Chlorella vulgaris]